nr:immunoglobulin light chain junction region [Macaca mulatta]
DYYCSILHTSAYLF